MDFPRFIFLLAMQICASSKRIYSCLLAKRRVWAENWVTLARQTSVLSEQSSSRLHNSALRSLKRPKFIADSGWEREKAAFAEIKAVNWILKWDPLAYYAARRQRVSFKLLARRREREKKRKRVIFLFGAGGGEYFMAGIKLSVHMRLIAIKKIIMLLRWNLFRRL